jgi:two-component system LytT family response regulator
VRPIRTVIVEDMALAREKVRRFLAEEPDIEIAGEAADGRAALRLIAAEAPDLVFLDVGLPDMDAFAMVERMDPASRPVIVFLTAHEQHALKAFEVAAIDYLLKPFDRERFNQALNRARGRVRQKAGEASKPDYLRRLAVKEAGRTEVIDLKDVDYVDVAGHYLCIHVGKTVHLMRGTLSELEHRLDPAEFVRVHRSALARLDRIRSAATRRNGDFDLILASGARVSASRTYRDRIRERLGLEDF